MMLSYICSSFNDSLRSITNVYVINMCKRKQCMLRIKEMQISKYANVQTNFISFLRYCISKNLTYFLHFGVLIT